MRHAVLCSQQLCTARCGPACITPDALAQTAFPVGPAVLKICFASPLGRVARAPRAGARRALTSAAGCCPAGATWEGEFRSQGWYFSVEPFTGMTVLGHKPYQVCPPPCLLLLQALSARRAPARHYACDHVCGLACHPRPPPHPRRRLT